MIVPQIFSSRQEVRAGMSTRLNGEEAADQGVNRRTGTSGGLSHIDPNRNTLCAHLGFSEHELAIPLQCHSHTVLRVKCPGEYNNCDALVTDEKRVALSVTTADCVPILLFDPIHRSIGAVHAGWRGTADAIVQRTLEIMREEFNSDPIHILAYIGPSAGACC